MDLNRVATFVRVVEAGSFTAAAKLLHLPISSVSRSVAKLEQELELVLLERTTRSITLTDAGRAYFERAREAMIGLDEATQLAGDAAREPSGVVHLAAPPELSGKLVSSLGAFVRRYPAIHVDLMTTVRGAELVGGEVDLAIVQGRLEDSELIARRLGVSMHRLFASTEYVARRGKPRTVAELARHDAVLYRGTGGRSTWELTGPRGVESVEMKGSLSSDSHQLVVALIHEGHGIGLVPEQFLQRCQPAPALVPILPKWTAVGALQSLVHASRHLPRRVALLRDFLVEEMQACNGDHAGAEPERSRIRPRHEDVAV